MCQAFEEKLLTYLGNVDELCGLLKKFWPKDQFQSQDFTCDSGAWEKRLSKSNRYAWRPWAASCVQMLFACTQSWTTSTLWQLMRQGLWLALFLYHVRDRFAFGRRLEHPYARRHMAALPYCWSRPCASWKPSDKMTMRSTWATKSSIARRQCIIHDGHQEGASTFELSCFSLPGPQSVDAGHELAC